MRLTLIHPAIGRRAGDNSYIRTWQMEPLPVAALAALTPRDVAVSFYDDRLEPIPYDAPADLVAISVETYTARRAYQIASEFRRRRVPVVMGGFHATLAPDEVARYAEAVVTGEAEEVWPLLIEDARRGRLEKFYHSETRAPLAHAGYDRRIFRGKRYLPLGLVESGRGCPFPCDFCAIQTFYGRTHRRRPIDAVVAELDALKAEKRLFFFVDDNFAADPSDGADLLDAIGRTGVRWVTQLSINAAHDEACVHRLAMSGCHGVLIGFESLDPANLRRMRKSFNTMKGGYGPALANLRRHGVRVYGTFVFGYDHDTRDSFAPAVDFALEHKFYLAAFNHLTPFPGTPLYKRLAAEGRLLFDRWWLDDGYAYNRIPFLPARIEPDALRRGCVEARRRFFSMSAIVRRGFDAVNRADGFMARTFFLINAMHRAEIAKRDSFPLGDAAWRGPLLEAA